MVKGFYNLYVNFISLIFPARCPTCNEVLSVGELEVGFCKSCQPRIHRIGVNACLVCGKEVADSSGGLCLDCKQTKHEFVQNKAAYAYTDIMKKAMYEFKYSNRRSYGRAFANDIVDMYGDWIVSNHIEAITCVPVHKHKLAKRGYNQAAVLAKDISYLLDIPFVDILERVEDTQAQKELNNLERRKNLKNAFNIKPIGVKYKHILVVDDIYTTGATLDSVSRVLKRAGVRDVYCITACIGNGHGGGLSYGRS